MAALGAGLLVAMAAAWLAPEPVRAVPAALAVGLACAETAAWTRWLGGTVADTGLAVAVVAAALAAIGVIAAQGGLDRLLDLSAGRHGLDGPRGRVAAAVVATAAAGYLTGLALAYPQPGGFVLGVGAGLIAALAVCGLVRPRYGDGVAAALCLRAGRRPRPLDLGRPADRGLRRRRGRGGAGCPRGMAGQAGRRPGVRLRVHGGNGRAHR